MAIDGRPICPRSAAPAAALIRAECSDQVREWATTILATDTAISRTQYLPGVGHHIWNGLDDNNERAAAVITAFLEDLPARCPITRPAPTSPTFLQDER